MITNYSFTDYTVTAKTMVSFFLKMFLLGLSYASWGISVCGLLPKLSELEVCIVVVEKGGGGGLWFFFDSFDVDVA